VADREQSSVFQTGSSKMESSDVSSEQKASPRKTNVAKGRSSHGGPKQAVRREGSKVSPIQLKPSTT
jgi:hypothetical protein